MSTVAQGSEGVQQIDIGMLVEDYLSNHGSVTEWGTGQSLASGGHYKLFL